MQQLMTEAPSVGYILFNPHFDTGKQAIFLLYK